MIFTVPEALAGARVDVALADLADLPRNAVRRLCGDGRVRIDGARAKAGDRVRPEMRIELAGGGAWLAPDARVQIGVLLETDALVVVDKPRGVPCHPLVPGEGGTVVDALVARFPEIAHASPDEREAGLVHRLDTDTSGALAIARTRAEHTRVRTLFGTGAVQKSYLSLVEGHLAHARDIDMDIAHDPADPRRMVAVDSGGQRAHTRVTPLARREGATLVEVDMKEGRRHQVRVHLAHAGHPLVGDVLYGARAVDGGHRLHAWRLKIPGVRTVEAPAPEDLAPP